MNVSIAHVDTCLPSFLTDHHNRDGECLFGVYVDGTTTIGEVISRLVDEMEARENIPDYITDNMLSNTLRNEFEYVNPNALFDNSLDVPETDDESDDGDETCQAWFVLTWETPND